MPVIWKLWRWWASHDLPITSLIRSVSRLKLLDAIAPCGPSAHKRAVFLPLFYEGNFTCKECATATCVHCFLLLRPTTRLRAVAPPLAPLDRYACSAPTDSSIASDELSITAPRRKANK